MLFVDIIKFICIYFLFNVIFIILGKEVFYYFFMFFKGKDVFFCVLIINFKVNYFSEKELKEYRLWVFVIRNLFIGC